MGAIEDILEEDRFEARLRANTALDPVSRKRRLAYLESKARRQSGLVPREEIPLEFETDIPVIPPAGSVLPSVRMFGRGEEKGGGRWA